MKKEYAFVTFMMRNDAFLPGALVLAYAMQCQQSTYARVCMVDQCVSKKAREALEILYEDIIEVETTHFQSYVHGGRDDRGYLLTRFHALRLGNDGDLGRQYERIVLLDADVLPIQGYDALLNLPAPAGIIQEQKRYCVDERREARTQWHWHARYNTVCPHGSRIPREITDRVYTDPENLGVSAAIWRIDPTMEDYEQVMRLSWQEPYRTLLERKFRWPEMQLATLYWSGRWHNMDIMYCSIGGYPDINVLYGSHFAGIKPWQTQSRSIRHYAAYPDFQLWYRYFSAMVYAHPSLLGLPCVQRVITFLKAER